MAKNHTRPAFLVGLVFLVLFYILDSGVGPYHKTFRFSLFFIGIGICTLSVLIGKQYQN